MGIEQVQPSTPWARVRGAVDVGIGIAAQLTNLAVRHVEGWAPDVLLRPSMAESDLIVLQRPDARRGAELVNRALRIPVPEPVDFDTMRADRPLLASTPLDVRDARDSHELELDVQVQPGMTWRDRENGSARIAVYVDGRYMTDVVALAERDSAYRVNLAGLDAGRHSIELRAADDDVTADATPRARITATRIARLDGEAALVARFAPIIESRVPARGGSGRALDTDLPLLLAPTVERRSDGTTEISYDLLLSNEDGGIAINQAYSMLGRSIDQEIVYRVVVDANGERVSDVFQGPLHVPYAFRGERVGERPVLRIATANNLFTSNLSHAAPRWSDLPIAAATTRRSDRELLLAHPWTGAIMAAEAVREGKMSEGGRVRGTVDDARRYLFLGPSGDAIRGAYERDRGLELVLRDGRAVRVSRSFRLPFWVPFKAPMGTAVHLPDGIDGDAIVGVRALGNVPTHATSRRSTTFVLDNAYRPRQLTLSHELRAVREVRDTLSRPM